MAEGAPELRVGDAERRVVDDRLMAAVGEGQLTLREYDERAGQLWQARTRSELDVLTADLPAPITSVRRDNTATSSPTSPGASLKPAAARPGPLRRLARRFGGLAVPLVLVGGLVLAGPDGVSIFGSTTTIARNEPGTQTDVDVSVLFGSVEVVIPDGAVADTSGVVVFGSVDCKVACSGIFTGFDSTGQVVHIRAMGGFGSVDIKTASEAAASSGD